MESRWSAFFKIDRIHYSMFDVGRSMFDVHQFLSRFNWPLLWPAAAFVWNYKKWRMKIDEWRMMESLREIFLNRQNTFIRRSMLDVRCSMFISFYSDQTGRFSGQRRCSYETSWNDECRMSNVEWLNRFAKSFLKRAEHIIRCWTFDVRRLSVSLSI